MPRTCIVDDCFEEPTYLGGFFCRDHYNSLPHHQCEALICARVERGEFDLEEIDEAISGMEARLADGQGNKTMAMCRLSLPMTRWLRRALATELERDHVELATDHLARYGTGALRPVVCGECNGRGNACYDASRGGCQDWEEWAYGMRRLYNVVRGHGGRKLGTKTVGFQRVTTCRRCGSWGVVLIGDGAYGPGQEELAERELWATE